MSIKNTLSNPLTGLAIVISFSLIAIFVAAYLTDLKKKQAKNEVATTMSSIKVSIETVVKLEESDKRKKKPREICNSPECITLSYQLLNWKDSNIDPCDDFQKFVCGKYPKDSEPGNSKSIEKDEKIVPRISDFLNKSDSSDSKSENLMQLYYKKCLENSEKNLETFEETQKLWYQEIFSDIRKVGSWPSAEKNWDESKFDLNEILSKMAESRILNFGLFKLQKDSKSRNLNLVAPGSLRWNKKILEGILNSNEFSTESLEQDLQDVDAFSKKIQDLKNENSNFEDLESLTSHIPSIDFDEIIRKFAKQDEKIEEVLRKKIRVGGSELFFGKHDNLENILKTTSNRTLANFLILKFVQEAVKEIPSDFRSSKSMDCGKIAIHHFPQTAIQIMTKNYDDKKENLKTVSKIFDDVRDSYIEIVRNSTKIPNESKNTILDKLKNMEKKIAYSKEDLDLDKEFGKLDFSTTDSYYTLSKKLIRFKNDKILEYITEESLLDPQDSIQSITPFYNRSQNSMLILVPITDDPVFGPNYPKSSKIASIGSLIAQAIGESIDFTGQDEQRKCLIDQYNQNESGNTHNQTLLMNNLVSQQYAMEATWQTFKNLDSSEERIIPGFKEEDDEKLFFQLYALNSCGQNFNQLFSNMKKFAEVFNCPAGSPMNPDSRCELF
ncbi:hypothetical protein B9Z55_007195 [Caenorhabditis nigoni]|uniref:Peptidase M13 C-terminal domain-containing protein n=1 Tax=Caenorhabditis nigoni TaxID=1611254 RepID=A0A2G5V987_9PELO|nr:hypothetical protein B9Z55_007195 [Caenorhabditis nigoni]